MSSTYTFLYILIYQILVCSTIHKIHIFRIHKIDISFCGQQVTFLIEFDILM